MGQGDAPHSQVPQPPAGSWRSGRRQAAGLAHAAFCHRWRATPLAQGCWCSCCHKEQAHPPRPPPYGLASPPGRSGWGWLARRRSWTIQGRLRPPPRPSPSPTAAQAAMRAARLSGLSCQVVSGSGRRALGRCAPSQEPQLRRCRGPKAMRRGPGLSSSGGPGSRTADDGQCSHDVVAAETRGQHTGSHPRAWPDETIIS
jgi:hypothetical protein